MLYAVEIDFSKMEKVIFKNHFPENGANPIRNHSILKNQDDFFVIKRHKMTKIAPDHLFPLQNEFFIAHFLILENSFWSGYSCSRLILGPFYDFGGRQKPRRLFFHAGSSFKLDSRF